jgi:hypothetical protein
MVRCQGAHGSKRHSIGGSAHKATVAAAPDVMSRSGPTTLSFTGRVFGAPRQMLIDHRVIDPNLHDLRRARFNRTATIAYAHHGP